MMYLYHQVKVERSDMKITFIRPNFLDARSPDAWEPLALAVLAGLTPKHIELDFYDEHLEPIPHDHETDLVALTATTFTARRAYQIATDFRRLGIPVVMGGYHPSFLPEEALAYADSVVIGDAEEVWAHVVQDSENGDLRQTYKGSKLPQLDRLNYDRRIFKGKNYNPISFLKFSSVHYSRGCRYTCDFCSIHAFYGAQTRHRPVADLVAEIKALDRKFIVFVDDNLFVNVSMAEELFRALIPLNIRWACQISLDVANNSKLLNLMAKSGCVAAVVGFESINRANLGQMKKGWNIKNDAHIDAIQKFHDLGIMIYATFVFGYDNDTVDSFDITAEFAIRSKFALSNFLALTPTPGSPLYARLMAENRLIYDRWWLDPNYRFGEATFYPLKMTPDELREGCSRARKIFYKSGSIFKRMLGAVANNHDPTSLLVYLATNLVVKSSLFSKIGCRLGAAAPLIPQLDNIPLALNSSSSLVPGSETVGSSGSQ
jgi:radical SAM superfamily enzyme YgiQ (UPF0313 family)